MKYLFSLKYKVDNREVFSENLSDTEDFSLEFAETENRHAVTLTAKKDITLLEYKEYSHDCFENKKADKKQKYFINGYQSWTDTKEFYANEKEHNLNKIPQKVIDKFAFDRYGDSLFYDYKSENLHGYDVFYTKGKSNLFIASLNQNNAYLIIELERSTGKISLIGNVKGKVLKAGETFTLADYIYYFDIEKGINSLKEHIGNKPPEKIFGYTSWYNYYQDINENIIMRDLESLDERFNLFQIDDGYETFVGDWLDVDSKKFPDGLGNIVDAIHKKGYLAGIWLAPFVAEEKSRLFGEHPDWFKKDKNGNFVKCGGNWSGFYALDLENSQVKEYIKTCLQTYSDMGFDFFKLDFLYASSLPEYYGKTSSEVATTAYKFLREVLTDKLILGCGATLSNACKLFDYMRIGPDVSLKFDDAFYMRFMHRERVSTKTTLQNTIYRSFLNGIYFGNDPDVFLLRDDNLSLSKEQRKALTTINALFGSVMMTSDNISEYDSEKKELVSAALELFNDAKVVSFERKGKIIDIVYSLDGKDRLIKYNTEKGVLI